MKFDLLNNIGLGEIDFSYIVIGLSSSILFLLILIIIQMVQYSKLKNKMKKFMSGKDAVSLEDLLNRIVEDNKYIRELSEDNKKEIRKLKKDMEFSFNKVGIVKYDAFKQMGGNLSFSLCLLNERNDGYILNSVHSSEGCYTYIKELKAGICELELSNEEKEAFNQAAK